MLVESYHVSFSGMEMTKELLSDIHHLAINLDYFSDIEIGRFMRKVLIREIEKGKQNETIKEVKKKTRKSH